MWNERQEYVEALRKITDEIQQVREEILLAEATQRIKEEAADEAQSAYDRWKTSLIMSGVLLGAALLLILIARIVLARVIREPERRYTVNKAFSLATTILVVLRLDVHIRRPILQPADPVRIRRGGSGNRSARNHRQFLRLVFHPWQPWLLSRVIGCRSAGNSARSWTSLSCAPRSSSFSHSTTDGKPGGANPTGGLIVLMNNAVFKHTLINYTRGYPYVWCSLAYNVTFESNWDDAREILHEAMLAEREIVETAPGEEVYRRDGQQFSHSSPLDRTGHADLGQRRGCGIDFAISGSSPFAARVIGPGEYAGAAAIQQSDDIRFAYWTVRSIATPPKEQDEPKEAVDDKKSETAKPSAQLPQDIRKAG